MKGIWVVIVLCLKEGVVLMLHMKEIRGVIVLHKIDRWGDSVTNERQME